MKHARLPRKSKQTNQSLHCHILGEMQDLEQKGLELMLRPCSLTNFVVWFYLMCHILMYDHYSFKKNITVLFAFWKWICLGLVSQFLLRTPLVCLLLSRLLSSLFQICSVSRSKPSLTLSLSTIPALPLLTYPHHSPKSASINLDLYPPPPCSPAFLSPSRPRVAGDSVPPISSHLVHQRRLPDSPH